MSLLPPLTPLSQQLPIFGALLFFVLFIITTVIAKAASSENVYQNINRIHQRFAIYYITIISGAAFLIGWFGLKFLIGLAFGVYIYYTLHYTLLFPLVGLCRKSISFAILDILHEAACTGDFIDFQRLHIAMARGGVGAESIRSSRLEQMTLLGFAKKNGDRYQITPIGKKVHLIGEFFLRAWNQERL